MATVPMLLVALGAISLGIGVAYMRTETKMRFHLFWVALGIVLVALGAAMATGVWYALPAVVRLFVRAALGVFALYELGAHALILRHFRDMAAPGMDYVVVLGAQVFDSGPGRTLATRLDAACAYLAANPQTRCITCGGQGHSEPTSEARAGADYLVQRGIDPARIILEERSHMQRGGTCRPGARSCGHRDQRLPHVSGALPCAKGRICACRGHCGQGPRALPHKQHRARDVRPGEGLHTVNGGPKQPRVNRLVSRGIQRGLIRREHAGTKPPASTYNEQNPTIRRKGLP